MEKALLRKSILGLDLTEPVHSKHTPRGTPIGVPSNQAANMSLGHPTPSSAVIGQRGSTPDSVIPRQCQEITVSPDDSVTGRQCQSVTLSQEQDQKPRKVFRQFLKNGELKPVSNYDAIPGVLLREVGLFENPFDFMIYLHLFSKSYGYGRNTCDMGLKHLETFTGLSRNSVKKSLERLVKKRWIKMISDYEYARATRKWRVFTPYELGLSKKPVFEETGSSHDTVTVRHCHDMTQTESSVDPLTGSRRDTYKEVQERNFKESSLSELPEKLRKYFSELKPQSKRESEWQAFLEIQKDFKPTDIADCLAYLQESGILGGATCHSPLAYLAKAMSEILATVESTRERKRRIVETASRAEEAIRVQERESAREAQEWEEKERAFNRAFPGEDRQIEVVTELCRGMPFRAKSQAGRTYAVGEWWDRLNRYEKQELAIG